MAVWLRAEVRVFGKGRGPFWNRCTGARSHLAPPLEASYVACSATRVLNPLP